MRRNVLEYCSERDTVVLALLCHSSRHCGLGRSCLLEVSAPSALSPQPTPPRPTTMPWLLKAAQILAVVVATILLTVQMWSNVSLWLREPLSSSYTLDSHYATPLLPSVTVCPFPPLNIPTLVDMGLNASTDNGMELMRRLQELENIEATPEEVWKTAAWGLGAVVRQLDDGGDHYTYSPDQVTAPGWSQSFTPLGPCLTYHPTSTASRYGTSLQLQINRHILPQCKNENFDIWDSFSCENNIDLYCNTSCTWERLMYSLHIFDYYKGHSIILHGREDPPTLVDIQAVVPILPVGVDFKDVNIWVKPQRLELLGSATSPCRSTPEYSEAQCRQLCGEPCHPRSLKLRPQHSTWTSTSHLGSCLWPLDEEDFEYQNLTEELYACIAECLPCCSRTVFNYFVSYQPSQDSPPYIQVTLRPQANFLPTLTESQAYPLWRLLADAGGSLGLFLGVSLLSFWYFLGNHLFRHTSSPDSATKVCQEKQPSATSHITVRPQPQQSKVHGWSEAGDLDVIGTGTTTVRGKWVKLWELVGITALLGMAGFHTLITFTSYIQSPLATSLMLTKDTPPFPSVTVCPDMPFKPKVMTDYGIMSEVESSCEAQRESLLSTLLEDLPGAWRDDQVDLQELWHVGAKDQNEVIASSYSFGRFQNRWEPVLTTNNICYQLSPSNFSANPSELSLKLTFTFDDVDDEKILFGNACLPVIKSFWVIIPNMGTRPLLVSQIESHFYTYNFWYERGKAVTLQPLVLQAAPPCLSAPYSRTTCLHRCFLQSAATHVGCTLPYINVTHLPKCQTKAQYQNSLKYIVSPNSLQRHSSLSTTKCEEECPKECHSTYYLVDSAKMVPLDVGFDVTVSEDYYMIVREYISYSTSSLLCQFGGIVGLYVGWAVLGAGEALESFLASTRKGNVLRRVRGIILPVCYLLCFMASAVLWTERVYEFVWNHPYYTAYQVESISSDHFPALTVCRWPPFNLSRILQLGLAYNGTASCDYNGRFYYRCKEGTEAIQRLTGLWGSLPLDEIWEEAAWDLEDLVTGFTLDSQNYLVNTTDSEVSGVWQTVVMEHNRCFTFSPTPGTSLTSYSVTLNTQYTGQRKVKTNDTLQMLMNALKTYNRAVTFIRLHGRKENIYKFPEDAGFREVGHHNPRSVQFTVEQTEMKLLPRKDQPCEDSEQYSQEVCVAQCQASYTASTIGCRLPYMTWSSHLPLCNNSYHYFKYPRRLGHKRIIDIVTYAEDGHTEKRPGAFCQESCPLACTTQAFKFTQKQSISSNSIMTVR